MKKKYSDFNIKRFTNAVNKIDDELGGFADYEGYDATHNGPTTFVYRAGRERFIRRCQQAIDLHTRAARLWQRALKFAQDAEE